MSNSIPPWMACFSHLLCPNLLRRFEESADPTVADAVERSKTDFFISYRYKETEAYAKQLAEQLKALGYEVYHTGSLTLPDEDELLRKNLTETLHSSSVLIIIGSANTFEGQWTRWENEVFDETWGRMVPLITPDLNSADVERFLGLRSVSSAIVYEEDLDSWSENRASAITVLCMALAREFFRIELLFWMSCASIPREKRVEAYFEAINASALCRTLIRAMHWPDRVYSLGRLQKGIMKDARKREAQGGHKSTLGRIMSSLMILISRS